MAAIVLDNSVEDQRMDAFFIYNNLEWKKYF
jgi:hypothetical protein